MFYLTTDGSLVLSNHSFFAANCLMIFKASGRSINCLPVWCYCHYIIQLKRNVNTIIEAPNESKYHHRHRCLHWTLYTRLYITLAQLFGTQYFVNNITHSNELSKYDWSTNYTVEKFITEENGINVIWSFNLWF